MAGLEDRPWLLMADQEGNMYDEPELLMVCRQGNSFVLPKPDDYTLLPDHARFVLLPKGHALGLDPESGELEQLEEISVAALLPPQYIVTGHPAAITDACAAAIPENAYAAIGFFNEKIYACVKKLTFPSSRKITFFTPREKKKCLQAFMTVIGAHPLLNVYKKSCFDPLVSSRAWFEDETSYTIPLLCLQNEQTGSFPSLESSFFILVMDFFLSYFTKPVRFFIGSESGSDPLFFAKELAKAISSLRSSDKDFSCYLRTHGENKNAVKLLMDAGLTGYEAVVSSAHPQEYQSVSGGASAFFDSMECLQLAQDAGILTALDLEYCPGRTDREEEVASLAECLTVHSIKRLFLHNALVKPLWFQQAWEKDTYGPAIGLQAFLKRLKNECSGLKIGYPLGE